MYVHIQYWRLLAQDMPATSHEHGNRDNYRKAIEWYRPIVSEAMEKGMLTSVSASVLGNLCVAYIMNEQNPEAEALMKALEQEETDGASKSGTNSPVRCMINLQLHCDGSA